MAGVAFLGLVSCNNKANNFSAERVKTETSARSTVNYFYGPDKSLSYTINNMGIKDTYKAEGNVLHELISDTVHGQSVSSTIYLDAKGFADSSSTVTPGGVYLDIFTHNADGNATTQKKTVNGQMVNNLKFVFTDGNQSQVSVLDTANTEQVKVYFTYYTDKPYSLRNENYGRKFLGNDSKNPIKSFVQIRVPNDTMRVFTFKYNYDDKGRVSSKVVSDKSGMVIDSTTVSYY